MLRNKYKIFYKKYDLNIIKCYSMTSTHGRISNNRCKLPCYTVKIMWKFQTCISLFHECVGAYTDTLQLRGVISPFAVTLASFLKKIQTWQRSGIDWFHCMYSCTLFKNISSKIIVCHIYNNLVTYTAFFRSYQSPCAKTIHVQKKIHQKSHVCLW